MLKQVYLQVEILLNIKILITEIRVVQAEGRKVKVSVLALLASTHMRLHMTLQYKFPVSKDLNKKKKLPLKFYVMFKHQLNNDKVIF